MPTRRCAGRGGLAQPAPRSSAVLAQCESHGPTRTPSSRTRTADSGTSSRPQVLRTALTAPPARPPAASPQAPGPVPSQASPRRAAHVTLHATRWGQNFPKPRGGWILLSRVTTSRCLIRPLREDSRLVAPAAPPGAASCSEGEPRGEPGTGAGCLTARPPSGSGSWLPLQRTIRTAHRQHWALFWGQDSLRYGVSRPGIRASSPGFDPAGWGLSAELVEGWRGVEAIRTKRGNTWWLHRARLLGASECELAPRAVSGRQRCTQGPCARLTGRTDPVGPGLRALRLCQAPGCWRWTTL